LQWLDKFSKMKNEQNMYMQRVHRAVKGSCTARGRRACVTLLEPAQPRLTRIRRRPPSTVPAAAGKPKDGSVPLGELAADPAGLERIKALRRECAQLGEEKVALAQQAFELVEGHIARLDGDLSVFTEHLRVTGQIPRGGGGGGIGAGGGGGGGREGEQRPSWVWKRHAVDGFAAAAAALLCALDHGWTIISRASPPLPRANHSFDAHSD
jgi:hypothetical protein